MDLVRIVILGCSVEVACGVPGAKEALEAGYGTLENGSGDADLSYSIGGSAENLRLARAGQASLRVRALGDFIRVLDADLRVELQKLRADLYFVHSGVVRRADRAFLVVGAAGSGKSTTCWGLSHFGFSFLSDELAPVDVGSLSVLPYVRALHLKKEPAGDFPLPGKSLRTAGSIHIPLDGLPGGVHREAAPVRAIFFLTGRPGTSEPRLRRLSAAEAATRIYANSLNALAHPADGLDASVSIADNMDAYALTTGPLADTCELIKGRVDGLATV